MPYLSYSESFYQETTGADRAATPFEPTRGKQYEAGVKYQPPGTASLFTAAVFEITKSNLLQPDPLDPNFRCRPARRRRAGSSSRRRRRGAASPSTRAMPTSTPRTRPAQPFWGVPKNQASAWLRVRGDGRLAGLTAGFGVRYVGSTESEGVTSPSFTLYDAMLGYLWDRYQVMLTGRNLADTTYVTTCDTCTCYYGETRTLGLTLSAAF